MKKFLVGVVAFVCLLVVGQSVRADVVSSYVYSEANNQFQPLPYNIVTVTVEAYYNGAAQPGYSHAWDTETDGRGQFNDNYPTPPDTAHITKMTWKVTSVAFYTIISAGSGSANQYQATASIYPTTCR